jgi:hypothetical protein
MYSSSIPSVNFSIKYSLNGSKDFGNYFFVDFDLAEVVLVAGFSDFRKAATELLT